MEGGTHISNIIYLGSHYPSKLKEELLRKHAFVDFPADVFQQAILKGLNNNGCKVDSLSSIKISKYPFYKRIIFKSYFFSNSKDNDGIYIGQINFPGLNYLSKTYRMTRYLKRLVSEGGSKHVLIYAISVPSLLATFINRKQIKTATLIVPDLPEYMSSNRNPLYRIGKFIEKHFIRILLTRIDKFVLLSSYMCERLPIRGKQIMVMEGIYSQEECIQHIEKVKSKLILYSGNLGMRYGILDLLYAFETIRDSNYRLMLCGNGDSVEEIKQVASKDNRVEYLGVLSRKDVLELQCQATLLVNPRHKTEEYTRYSFPSKTMEYLASGTPTLMSHLTSIPREYDPYIYYFDDESVVGMSKKIVEICSKTQEELSEFGSKAAEFVRKQKNPEIQMKRVLDFIAEQ